MTVVDASVVIKWVVDEPDAVVAREIALDGAQLIAPSHLMAEVGRGLLRSKRAGILSVADAERALRGLQKIVALEPLERLALLAFTIADNASVTIYDALYVALAEQADDVLVTADRRLCDGLKSTPWAGRAQHIRERPARRDR